MRLVGMREPAAGAVFGDRFFIFLFLFFYLNFSYLFFLTPSTLIPPTKEKEVDCSDSTLIPIHKIIIVKEKYKGEI